MLVEDVMSCLMSDGETVARCAMYAMMRIRGMWDGRDEGRRAPQLPRAWADWSVIVQNSGLCLYPLRGHFPSLAELAWTETQGWALYCSPEIGDDERARCACQALAVYTLMTDRATSPLLEVPDDRRETVLQLACRVVQGGAFGDVRDIHLMGPSSGRREPARS